MGLESFFFPRPGLAPAGDLLSFASPKERKQRKGDPAVCDPPLRCGQPAVLAFRGVSPKLASLKQGRALIRETLRSSAHTEGLGGPTGHRCARRRPRAFASLGLDWLPPLTGEGWGGGTRRSLKHCRVVRAVVPPSQPSPGRGRSNAGPVRMSCLSPSPPGGGPGWGHGGRAKQRPNCKPSKAMARSVPTPSGCAEERSGSRIRARSCLSEASSARPRETRAPQVARSAAKGRRQWGRLSFAYLSLAKQRKVGRLPGRDPASGRKQTQGQQEC
ncbi:hypothetical protein QF040_004478 [Variovorax sp. W2I14]